MEFIDMRRFEQITDDSDLIERFRSLVKEKNLSREDLAIVLLTVRVRRGLDRRDFGI